MDKDRRGAGMHRVEIMKTEEKDEEVFCFQFNSHFFCAGIMRIDGEWE
jgi:hypothetical protein